MMRIIFGCFPKMEYLSGEYWFKYDPKNFKIDYTPIVMDPSGKQTKNVKSYVEYVPDLYFFRDLINVQKKIRIKFYVRFLFLLL